MGSLIPVYLGGFYGNLQTSADAVVTTSGRARGVHDWTIRIGTPRVLCHKRHCVHEFKSCFSTFAWNLFVNRKHFTRLEDSFLLSFTLWSQR